LLQLWQNNVYVQQQLLVNWLKAKKWHKSVSITCVLCIYFASISLWYVYIWAFQLYLFL
jgi:hypothetical protein